MSTPGALVRRVREWYDLTQADLARHMKVTPTYIAMVERGERAPSKQFMAHLELVDWKLSVEQGKPIRAIIRTPSEDDPPPLASIVGHPRRLNC